MVFMSERDDFDRIFFPQNLTKYCFNKCEVSQKFYYGLLFY